MIEIYQGESLDILIAPVQESATNLDGAQLMLTLHALDGGVTIFASSDECDCMALPLERLDSDVFLLRIKPSYTARMEGAYRVEVAIKYPQGAIVTRSDRIVTVRRSNMGLIC